MLGILLTQGYSLIAYVLVALYPLYYLSSVLFKRSAPKIKLAVPPKTYPSQKTVAQLEAPDLRKRPGFIQCIDPSTGDLLDYIQADNQESIAQKASLARQAQQKWVQTSFSDRRQVLESLLAFVVDNQENICRVASRDSGKTMLDGSFGEILTTCEKLRWTIAEGEKYLMPETRSVGLIMAHKRASLVYEPIGLVGAIVSWNYPFHNVIGPIISALFAGNAFMVKCSEYVAWSSFHYYEPLIKNMLVACGHSPDLVSFVYGFAEQGQLLVDTVDKLTFIGSPGVGKLVMQRASASLTPVVLELGGKDVAIICQDADLSQVVDLVMRGVFQNCGQNCIGLERLLVHASVYDDLLDRLETSVKALTVGSTCAYQKNTYYDCGAMTMPSSLSRIKDLVDDAVSKGARLLVGGAPHSHPEYPHGSYFEPTLLADVTPNMQIAQEEVFGPVMAVFKINDDAHAVEIANSSPFGLGSNVFTACKKRFQFIMSRLRVGMCNHNDFAVSYLCQSLPFGGVGVSGFDRFAGIEGLRGNCQLKAVTTDKIAFVKTTLPAPLKYPVDNMSFDFSSSLVSLLYAPRLSTKLAAIVSLIKKFLKTK